ncbi:hypothetical protein MKW92_014369 [Papaver armeniacum]|nr:hypothetical protein MKW92_014369 [Papaver armeniacum]
MVRTEYIAMKTDEKTTEALTSDLQDLKSAAKKFANDVIKLGGFGFGSSFFQWLSCVAAMYVLLPNISLNFKYLSYESCFSCKSTLNSVDFVSSWIIIQVSDRICLLERSKFRMSEGFLTQCSATCCSYLLILDRTNWKTEMLTQLLIPYIFFTLPSVVFDFIRGDPGKWVAFVAVVLRLFFPKHFPDWFEMPGALVLLLVVTPHLFAHTLRNSWGGVAICLAIACFLLQEHIQKSGGFRKSFTQRKGLSNSIGILLLMVYPVWALVRFII